MGHKSDSSVSKATPDLLTTGDMARLAGSTCRTVRFYEEAGILRPAARSDGGHRLFPSAELRRFRLVLDFREAGLSLNHIRSIFELKDNHCNAKAASSAMCHFLHGQVAEMNNKIQVLQRLEQELRGMIETLASCKVCEAPDFPRQCDRCSVTHHPDLPRAMKVLWKE